ncbi:MAG: transporter, partial [Acidocella sp. 20-61-6]
MLLAWLERHQRSVLTLALLLALAGLVAAFSLPIGLYPQTDFPRVRIMVATGSQPAVQMVQQVTQPIEQAVRAVPGVVDVNSTTSRGSAEILVDFSWGTDMNVGTGAVNAAIAQLLPSLPTGTNYQVLHMDPTVFPFMAFALTSDKVPPATLHDIANLRLVPLLSGVPGVGQVQVQGGDTGEIEVEADPARLSSYHLTLGDLSKAIENANVLQAVGQVTDHNLLYLLMANNPLQSVANVKAVVVRGGPGGVVRLSDVASVRFAAMPQLFRVSADGKQAVTVLLFLQRGGNMVTVAGAARATLAAFAPHLPPGISVRTWYDQSTLVTDSALSVRDAILIGVLLAGLVLFAFLRNLRVTLLALLVVPAALAAAVLVLSLMGLSFNIMTLGGLAASVGLVIDDVIVMIEHLAKYSSGKLGRGWVMGAGARFWRPLAGSSAATLLVFAGFGICVAAGALA